MLPYVILFVLVLAGFGTLASLTFVVWMLGYQYGITISLSNDNIWHCTSCDKKDGCLFFGSIGQARTVIARCMHRNKNDDLEIKEARLMSDIAIHDVSRGRSAFHEE